MKMTMRSTRLGSLLASLGAAALLAACGGGGDDGPPPPPNNDFNARAAWQNLLDQPNAWTMTGVGSDGFAYELRLSVAPVNGGVYPVTGEAAFRTDFATTLRSGNTVVGTGVSELYTNNALQLLGSRTTSSGVAGEQCDISTLVGVPPAAARIGDNGVLYSVTELNGCGPTAGAIATTDVRWSVAYTNGLPYFCLNAVTTDLLQPPTVSTETDCFEIDVAGNIGPHARVALSSPSFSLSVRN